MMNNKTITWAAVIDGNNAHFYSKGSELRLSDLNHTLTAKKPTNNNSNLGRVHDRMGNNRHIIEPHNSEKVKNDEQFTKEVAEYLEISLRNGEYNRLVVTAPPNILGILRKSLSQSVKDVIAIELDKDLTHFTPQQIQEHLEKIVHI